MKKIALLLVIALGGWVVSSAQDEAPKPKYVKATFNSTRIINMQSTEIVSKGVLQFLISHHFSPIWPKGGETQNNLAGLLGLNTGLAWTYLSFDYSINNYLNIGLAGAGRNRYEGFAKIKLLRQQTGLKNIPVSIGWYSAFSANAAKDPSIDLTWNKFSFINQLLIARKFNDKLSLQLIPTWIHYNLVPYGVNNSNEVYSMGLGGKFKLTSNKNITFEYSRQFNMFKNLIDKNGNIYDYKPDLLSLGMEFNTGGHLFQFYIGNTTHSSNIDQLTRNTSKPFENLAFGFTINRSMSLSK